MEVFGVAKKKIVIKKVRVKNPISNAFLFFYRSKLTGTFIKT